MSQGVPKRMRCVFCDSLRRGSVVTYTLQDGREIQETWNPETLAPHREIMHGGPAE